MRSPTQSEELSEYELGEDLEQTSHLSAEYLKPILEALQKAKQDEALANPDHAITQKIPLEVIEGLLEQVTPAAPPPAVAQAAEERGEVTLTMNAEKFLKALRTVPASMRDRVTEAFDKAKASLGSSVPQAFAVDAIQRELARAITSGHLSSLLERMRGPAFAATITAEYEKETSASPQ